MSASLVTVSTHFGVQQLVALDPEQIAALGHWLCEVNAYHDKLRSTISDAEWERQTRANGGCCDECRDFAGQILSSFDLRGRGRE